MTRALRLPAWMWYLFAGEAVITVSQLDPHLPGLAGWRSYTALYLAVNAASVVALVLGVRRAEPARRIAWLFVAANQAVYFVGDFLFYVGRNGWGWTSFPAPADAFYLGHYPLFIVGLVLLLRGRGARAVMDGLIAGIGLGVLSWIALIAPTVALPGGTLVRITSIAYPVLDLALFLTGIQLVFGACRRNRSNQLLVGALVLLFATDSIYSWMQLHGTYHADKFLDVMWLSYYLLLGAAALHPSIRTATASGPERRDPLRRQLLLVALTLVTPVVGIVQAARGTTTGELPVAVGSSALFLLVGARMLGLLGHQRKLLRVNAEQSQELAALVEELQAAQRDRVALLQQAVDTAESARIQLAADLHDGPIQRLASAGYTLDRAALHLDRGNAGTTGELIRDVRGVVGDEIVHLRRMMTELRPPILDNGGLPGAIRHHAEAFETRTRLSVVITDGVGETPLCPAVETALYRIYQEALTNIARHAEADHVWVEITRSGRGDVALRVEDDGRGFDTAQLRGFVREGHFGLAGMRERLETLRGTLSVRSAPGRGTTITAAVPPPVAVPGAPAPRSHADAHHPAPVG